MYQIAICDDEERELGKTEALLDAYRRVHPECHFSVRSYSSMEALVFEMANLNPFDLLLLDIYMPGKDGIKGARELRKNGYEGPIIFLTSSKEYALDAYNLNALQYILKPVEQTRFFSVLEKVLDLVNQERRRYLTLRADREMRRIALRNIIYCEAQNQYQALHLAPSEELRVRMTLAELYDTLCEFPDFVRVGSTYIVNLGYVDSLTAKEMTLSTGEVIWLPRGSYNILKRQYFDSYQRGGNS